MAEFKVKRLEGTQYVEVHLDDESVIAEAGALSYFVGDITLHSHVIPSPLPALRSMFANESVFRPRYTGTGVVTLESSLGGFHVIELNEETWILEPGSYWASEGDIEVGFHQERLLTSLRAGEGLIYLQTRVMGAGKVVVTTRGPVEEIDLEEGQSVAADGRYVICRSHSVSFSIRRPTKSWLGKYTSGEGLVRYYQGPGRLLLNPAPYWRYKMLHDLGNDMRVAPIDED